MGLLPQKGTACLPTVHLQGENVGFREDKDYVAAKGNRTLTCITVSPLGVSTYFAQISPLPRFSLSFTRWQRGLDHPKNPSIPGFSGAISARCQVRSDIHHCRSDVDSGAGTATSCRSLAPCDRRKRQSVRRGPSMFFF